MCFFNGVYVSCVRYHNRRHLLQSQKNIVIVNSNIVTIIIRHHHHHISNYTPLGAAAAAAIISPMQDKGQFQLWGNRQFSFFTPPPRVAYSRQHSWWRWFGQVAQLSGTASYFCYFISVCTYFPLLALCIPVLAFSVPCVSSLPIELCTPYPKNSSLCLPPLVNYSGTSDDCSWKKGRTARATSVRLGCHRTPVAR